MNPDQVAPAHREVIGAITGTIRPILDGDDSEELKQFVPRIAKLCVQLVQEDPNLLEFVRDLRETATRASIADWAANGKPIGEQGWSHLLEALDAAFPGKDLVNS